MDTVAIKKVEALYNHLISKQTSAIDQDDSKHEKLLISKHLKRINIPITCSKTKSLTT